jgi:uncharacterized protein (UPF0254 family)|tara:strand:+ start:810 stop:923 length:114 start_codon:yes stop_codon:yes gene_type:complete
MSGQNSEINRGGIQTAKNDNRVIKQKDIEANFSFAEN